MHASTKTHTFKKYFRRNNMRILIEKPLILSKSCTLAPDNTDQHQSTQHYIIHVFQHQSTWNFLIVRNELFILLGIFSHYMQATYIQLVLKCDTLTPKYTIYLIQ